MKTKPVETKPTHCPHGLEIGGMGACAECCWALWDEQAKRKLEVAGRSSYLVGLLKDVREHLYHSCDDGAACPSLMAIDAYLKKLED